MKRSLRLFEQACPCSSRASLPLLNAARRPFGVCSALPSVLRKGHASEGPQFLHALVYRENLQISGGECLRPGTCALHQQSRHESAAVRSVGWTLCRADGSHSVSGRKVMPALPSYPLMPALFLAVLVGGGDAGVAAIHDCCRHCGVMNVSGYLHSRLSWTRGRKDAQLFLINSTGQERWTHNRT